MPARTSQFNEHSLRRMGMQAACSALDGSAIAIGIVDWGFDVLHPCLLSADGTRSRFAAIWDQNVSPDPSTGVLERNVIDNAIDAARRTGSRAPVDAVLDPHANYCWREIPPEGAHGTLMASICAGTPFAGFRSAAPGSLLFAVQLALAEQDWKEIDATGEPTWRDWQRITDETWSGWRSYDEQVCLVRAMDFLYERAQRSGAKGLVINLSLGASAGAHDGGSRVERHVAQLVRRGERQGEIPCAVVVAAGNSGADEGHFAGTVRADVPASFSWRMGRSDPTPNKLELWYRCPHALDIELTLGHEFAQRRTAAPSFQIACGNTIPIVLGGRLAGIADHATNVRNGLSRARIILHPPYFPTALPRDSVGDIVFTIRLQTVSTEATAEVNAWLERDDGLDERSSLFPSHPEGTLGAIALAEGAIAVTGYDHRAHSARPGIFAFSSLGPSPWPHLDRQRAPHIAAPCVGIWGARSKTDGFSRTTGSSPAAALVSGAVALMMQADLRQGREIDVAAIRDRLAARACPVESGRSASWEPRYGWGAINVQHMFGEVRP